MSRGFETASYLTASLVSYQINRQLSGWHLPPLVFRAFGAHCLLLATSRPPAARNRLPLYLRKQTFSWPSLTSVVDPQRKSRLTRCDPLHQRLQPFRHLHDCSGCFRLERWPGGTCTHWKSAALPRRTPKADVGYAATQSACGSGTRLSLRVLR